MNPTLPERLAALYPVLAQIDATERDAVLATEAQLARVPPGELWVVSTSCLFGHHALTAHGQATAATDLVRLSPAGFARWAACEPFRSFVFGIFADRLADLMALADKLGTVREIVTRLLKRFEVAGWVTLGRERSDVIDSVALRALATGRDTPD